MESYYLPVSLLMLGLGLGSGLGSRYGSGLGLGLDSGLVRDRVNSGLGY